MRISVKQKHIDKGVRESSEFCPIALACKDGGINVPIVNRMISGYFVNRYICVDVPQKACYFIAAFDKGRKVEPFSFELGIS